MAEELSSCPVRLTPSKRVPKWDAFLVMLLAISLSLNVFLGWKVRRFALNGNIPSADILKEGVEVVSFEAYDMSDNRETITAAGAPTVFYVFSPSCHWCERNLENIKVLVGLRGDSYRFIGLSLGNANLEGYLSARKLAFPVYSKLSKDTIRNLKLSSTPQTIVVSPEGRVIRNWVGAYGENLRPEVEDFFAVKLPGITPEAGQTNSLDTSCP